MTSTGERIFEKNIIVTLTYSIDTPPHYIEERLIPRIIWFCFDKGDNIHGVFRRVVGVGAYMLRLHYSFPDESSVVLGMCRDPTSVSCQREMQKERSAIGILSNRDICDCRTISSVIVDQGILQPLFEGDLSIRNMDSPFVRVLATVDIIPLLMEAMVVIAAQLGCLAKCNLYYVDIKMENILFRRYKDTKNYIFLLGDLGSIVSWVDGLQYHPKHITLSLLTCRIASLGGDLKEHYIPVVVYSLAVTFGLMALKTTPWPFSNILKECLRYLCDVNRQSNISTNRRILMMAATSAAFEYHFQQECPILYNSLVNDIKRRDLN
jgi:hypothetical protein